MRSRENAPIAVRKFDPRGRRARRQKALLAESLERRVLFAGTAPDANLGTLGSTQAADQSNVTLSQGHDSSGNFFSTPTNRVLLFNLTSAQNQISVTATPTNTQGPAATGDLHLVFAKDVNNDGQLDQTELSQAASTFTAPSDRSSPASDSLTLGAGNYFVQLSVTNFQAQSSTGVFDATVDYTLHMTATAQAPAAIAVSSGGAAVVNGASATSTANGTDFGTATAGASTTHTFTVQNTGDSTLVLGAASVDNNSFDIASGLPPSISGHSSGTFSVEFVANATGQQSGHVSFSTNVSGANPFTFSISGAVSSVPAAGVAVADGSQSIASGQATAIDFGSHTQGDAAPTQAFTVSNTGNAALSLGSVSVPSGFSLLTPLPSSIAAGSSASFTVQMSTAVVGSAAGQVSFTTNAPGVSSFTFPISGAVTSQGSQPTQGLAVGSVTPQKIPASLVGGQKLSGTQVLVSLKNVSGAPLIGSAIVTVFASPSSSSVGAGSITLGHGVAKLKLNAGQSVVVKIKTTIPAVPADGTFFIVAQATGSGISAPEGIVGAAASTVTIRRQFIALQGPGASNALAGLHGKPLTFSLPISNQGDATASAPISLDLMLSTDGTLATATPLTTIAQKVNLKAGQTKALKIKLALPASAPTGSFVMLVRLRVNGAMAALNTLDGQIVATFPITIA